ncbi:MAG: PIN domain-containing protein [Burkholderiales bacterium]
MASALLDTGPVVALINRADAHHPRAVEFFQRFRGQLWSTEAVLTEVAYVLAPSLTHQTAALTWLQRSVNAGFLRFEGISDLSQVATLLTKYADLPADFADVSLVWLAQQKRIDKVVTVDERDFAVYKTYAGKPFKNLLA